MESVNSLLWRSALVTGLVIGVLNIVFSGIQYGFNALPLWFYLVQLLLIPAMLIPIEVFPRAAMTRDFMSRAVLFSMGWAVPYAIYKFAGDALNPAFSPASSLTTYLVTVVIFGLLFAVLRAPKDK